MTKRSKIETTAARSRLMASVRQSGTSLELTVRKILDSLGFDYETNLEDLPGTPDLADRNEKWAIFVHGCFWHAHEGCKRATIPKRNRDFWKKKFADNRQRDMKKIDRLEQIGYSVLVVWECELEDESALKKKISRFLTGVTDKRSEE